jgi:hypothetical protein
VFSVLKEIVYFGEKPYTSTDYGLLASLLIPMKLQKFPNDTFGWEAKIEGSVKYQSESVLNIEINHYTYTVALTDIKDCVLYFFDPSTGKSIPNVALFRDKNAFMAFAEKIQSQI